MFCLLFCFVFSCPYIQPKVILHKVLLIPGRPTPNHGSSGHSVSKTTEKSALHKAFSGTSQGQSQGYPDVWVPGVPRVSCPRTLSLSCFSFRSDLNVCQASQKQQLMQNYRFGRNDYSIDSQKYYRCNQLHYSYLINSSELQDCNCNCNPN